MQHRFLPALREVGKEHAARVAGVALGDARQALLAPDQVRLDDETAKGRDMARGQQSGVR